MKVREYQRTMPTKNKEVSNRNQETCRFLYFDRAICFEIPRGFENCVISQEEDFHQKCCPDVPCFPVPLWKKVLVAGVKGKETPHTKQETSRCWMTSMCSLGFCFYLEHFRLFVVPLTLRPQQEATLLPSYLTFSLPRLHFPLPFPLNLIILCSRVQLF